MGLGKTLQALLLAAQFQSEWPVLIVAPSSLRFVWREQAMHWLPQLVGSDGSLIHVIRSGKDKPPRDARIIIGTYDLLRRYEALRLRPDGRDFLVVVVDESHNIKEGKSLRAKAIVGLCKAARRAILLSGTPSLNRATELYTQLEALMPAEMPSFIQFAERYCIKEIQRFGRKTVERWGGARRNEELNCLLRGSVMVRRLKRDVLEQLPPKRRMRVPLDPDKMNQELLREVEKHTRVVGKDVEGFIADAGRFQPQNQGKTAELFRMTAEAKLGAVLDYMDHLLDLRAKFLIFGHHHCVLDALERRLRERSKGFVRIDGRTAATQRPMLVASFQEDPGVRVAVLSITAAGVGLTLTAAQTVVFAELYWVPGQMAQAEDRAHRIGQRDCVTVQYLVASGTLDDALYRALERKTMSTSVILNGRQSSLAAKKETPNAAATHAAAMQNYSMAKRTLEECCDAKEDLQKAPLKRLRWAAGCINQCRHSVQAMTPGSSIGIDHV